MGSKEPRLRIIQTSPTTYALQQQTWKGRLWWRKEVWEEYGHWYDRTGSTYIYGIGPAPGRFRWRSFDSIEAAEAWLQEQRALQQYPKVVKELSV